MKSGFPDWNEMSQFAPCSCNPRCVRDWVRLSLPLQQPIAYLVPFICEGRTSVTLSLGSARNLFGKQQQWSLEPGPKCEGMGADSQVSCLPLTWIKTCQEVQPQQRQGRMRAVLPRRGWLALSSGGCWARKGSCCPGGRREGGKVGALMYTAKTQVASVRQSQLETEIFYAQWGFPSPGLGSFIGRATLRTLTWE